MCPPPDVPMNGTDEMVAIDTTQPSLPPPAQTGASTVSTEAPANGNSANGEHSHPPPVKSHKGVYGRASDFLSNTSNWQVGHYGYGFTCGADLISRLSSLPFEVGLGMN
jgi:homocitrate synthase